MNRDGTVIRWKDSERTRCEVWTRVMGYMRPTNDFNIGKKAEYKERLTFKEEIAMKSLEVA
jgi:anaerobic ribonucleoside-triphosphate reductase